MDTEKSTANGSVCPCQSVGTLYGGCELPRRNPEPLIFNYIEPSISIPVTVIMEIYAELSTLTNELTNKQLAERLLKIVKGEKNG